MKKLFTILFFVWAIVADNCAQEFILNNNFEVSGNEDLSEWEITCGAESFRDAPVGGDVWSIKVFGGNTQGCFPGMAFQKIPTIVNGQQLILSGWAYTEVSQFVGIYFGSINNNVITIQTGDTTSSSTWNYLRNEFTAELEAGDTAVVVLDGGLVGGPLQGYGYFDLISLEQVTAVTNKEMPMSIKLFPNLVNSVTTLNTTIPLKNANIYILNSLGKTVQEVVNFSGNSLQLNCENLANGWYYMKVLQSGKPIAINKFFVAK